MGVGGRGSGERLMHDDLLTVCCAFSIFLVFFLPSSSSPLMVDLFIHVFIYLFIYLFIHIYLFIFIYLFICARPPGRLGFALILFWGRWGLPVPFRVPILGAVGMPIPVPKKTEEPHRRTSTSTTPRCSLGMTELFDDTKRLYGWEEDPCHSIAGTFD